MIDSCGEPLPSAWAGPFGRSAMNRRQGKPPNPASLTCYSATVSALSSPRPPSPVAKPYLAPDNARRAA